MWTPFTSDGEKKFSYSQQAQAGSVNLRVLKEAFEALVRALGEGDVDQAKILLEVGFSFSACAGWEDLGGAVDIVTGVVVI